MTHKNTFGADLLPPFFGLLVAHLVVPLAYGQQDNGSMLPFLLTPSRSKVGGQDVMAELKWLHEFDNKKRVEGDTVFFKILAKF